MCVCVCLLQRTHVLRYIFFFCLLITLLLSRNGWCDDDDDDHVNVSRSISQIHENQWQNIKTKAAKTTIRKADDKRDVMKPKNKNTKLKLRTFNSLLVRCHTDDRILLKWLTMNCDENNNNKEYWCRCEEVDCRERARASTEKKKPKHQTRSSIRWKNAKKKQQPQ